MNITIRGYDKDVLRWALNAGDWPRFCESDQTMVTRYAAHEAVHDPAKLAGIIGELLRSHGACANVDASSEGVSICQPRALHGHGKLLGERQFVKATMPQARRLAMQLLDMQHDARMDREHARIAAMLDEVMT